MANAGKMMPKSIGKYRKAVKLKGFKKSWQAVATSMQPFNPALNQPESYRDKAETETEDTKQ